MRQQKLELYFLFALLFAIIVLTFFIFKPFIYVLVLAIVSATIFYPIHKQILKFTKGRNSISSFISTILVLFVVIVPLFFLSLQLFQEATKLYTYVINNGSSINISKLAGDSIKKITEISPIEIDITNDISLYLKEGLDLILKNLGTLFKSATTLIISIFIFLLALYYLFKDGQKLKLAIIKISPFQDVYDETIFNKLKLAINSVIKGSFFTAILQGISTAFGFYIFGIPNATLWGTVAVFAALVPNVGTSLVIIPGIIYLYFNGALFSALGMLVWGSTAVGLIDNFLRPQFAKKGMMIHPFLILLSIIGGVSFFGPIGLLLGPLTLSLLFVLLEIYSSIIKKEEKNNINIL